MQKNLRQGDITIQTSINQAMSFGAIPCVRSNNGWFGYRHFSKFGCFPNWLLKLYNKQYVYILHFWFKKCLFHFILIVLTLARGFSFSFAIWCLSMFFLLSYHQKFMMLEPFYGFCILQNLGHLSDIVWSRVKKYQILNYVFG